MVTIVIIITLITLITQAQFEADKRQIYKHPLFPLLALMITLIIVTIMAITLLPTAIDCTIPNLLRSW